MQNQIEACFDTDRGQTQYLLNNKIYVFLTPLSENKKKIHNLIINLCVILKKLTANQGVWPRLHALPPGKTWSKPVICLCPFDSLA